MDEMSDVIGRAHPAAVPKQRRNQQHENCNLPRAAAAKPGAVDR